MLNRNFFLGALLALSVSFLVAFSNAKSDSNAVYEYVTIMQDDDTEIVISEQGKELRRAKIETKPKSYYDYRMLYIEVNKYEAAGWELYSTNNSNRGSAGLPQNYYMLRRKKQ